VFLESGDSIADIDTVGQCMWIFGHTVMNKWGAAALALCRVITVTLLREI
jgi:hypothetical protein